MSKAEAITILNIDRNYSPREGKVKYKILAIKYHPDKWSVRCNFSKSASEDILRSIVNAYETLK